MSFLDSDKQFEPTQGGGDGATSHGVQEEPEIGAAESDGEHGEPVVSDDSSEEPEEDEEEERRVREGFIADDDEEDDDEGSSEEAAQRRRRKKRRRRNRGCLWHCIAYQHC